MTNFNEGLYGNQDFSSNEERRGRYVSGDYENRNEERGWYGDPEGHSEAAERVWEHRGGSGGRGYSSSRQGGRSQSEQDYDNDYWRGGRSHSGHGGWFGDPERNFEASGREWESREGGRGYDKDN